MKRLLATIFTLLLSFSFLFAFSAYAAENPLAVSNNKIGVHVLFPTEIDKAASLVNSNGGDWGYVVIPIQSGDKDLAKWQAFMDKAKKLHVIPIIRLATEGDYFNTKVWRVPTAADVLDFANFLNSLSWPVKNRYIIVYNEVNRGDEWGGTPDPAAYAQLLSYVVNVFRERSTDFFILSAGMDNAAATTSTSMNEYSYFSAMDQAVPGIFTQVDGLSSHSYPNPAFSQPPTVISPESITSFEYEKQYIAKLTPKNLPTFITETGWEQDVVGPQQAANYLSTALQTVWAQDGIVTVAPFLLQAGGGPFVNFSLLDPNGNPNEVYNAIATLNKTKGAPVVNLKTSVLAAKTLVDVPSQYFTMPSQNTFIQTFEQNMKSTLKWFLLLR